MLRLRSCPFPCEVSPDVVRRARRKLAYIDLAVRVDDLRVGGVVYNLYVRDRPSTGRSIKISGTGGAEGENGGVLISPASHRSGFPTIIRRRRGRQATWYDPLMRYGTIQ